jgi:hypothetical protein
MNRFGALDRSGPKGRSHTRWSADSVPIFEPARGAHIYAAPQKVKAREPAIAPELALSD